MTEENKDPSPHKLRLSKKPKDANADAKAAPQESAPQESAAQETAPQEAPTPKPDLKLKRPMEAPKAQTVKAKEPPPPIETKVNETKVKASAEKSESSEVPADDSSFNPKNPFKSTAQETKVDGSGPDPAEHRPTDTPAESDDSNRRVEDAIDRIGEEKKSHGILPSIVLIVILLALLGGSGYGLYHILQSPDEVSESSSSPGEASDEQASLEEVQTESETVANTPIARAKAAIAKVPDSESALAEIETVSPTQKPTQPIEEPQPVEATGTNTQAAAPPATPPSPPPSIDSSLTSSVSEFLQSAHIGGVRTGDRPKLILNGQSYNKGDLVDQTNDLRFIGLRKEKLAFQDGQGVVYIKSF